MRKTGLLLVMIMLVMTVSVGAQKRKPIKPPVLDGTYCVVDDEGEGFMVFDAATGDFKCSMCEYGYAWGGTGTVKFDGLTVSFNAVTENYRIFGLVNVYDRVGKCVIEVYKLPNHSGFDIEPFVEYWEDSNTADSVMDCTAPPAKK
jgi:hypothetical protein